MKKILSLFLIMVFVSGLFSASVNASSYKDVADGLYYTDAIEALTTYGVVSGFDKSFRPTANVTRAEFAKISTLISGLDDQIHSNSGNKKFDDVALSHWATGYINTAANNKIIIGYPDGTFQPSKNVTVAEAITVVLRTMDYSTEVLGDNWPYAYMVKARSLGLLDGLNVGENQAITRADLCVIINRALHTSLNNSQNKLISKMNITITDEVLIIATREEDASLSSNEIKTSGGTYKVANSSLKPEAMMNVKLVLNDDKAVINFAEATESRRVSTTVDSVVDGETYFADGSSSISLDISSNTVVYNDGRETTYSSFAENIQGGAAVTIIFDENNSVRYLVFGNANYTEAVAVRSNVYSALGSVGVSREQVESASVIKNGYASALEDIEIYDVVYYLEDNSTIYVYNDKVSGVYNEAYPNKANVTNVDISGINLDIETQSAASKLGEKGGSFKIGSRLTALLGMDGKIVDVVDMNTSGAASCGILLSYSVENSTDLLENGKQYKYITVMNGEGNTMKCKTLTDYSEKIGTIGKISFDDKGNAVFTVMTSTTLVSGNIDKNNRKIGERWLTGDCKIIERTYAPDTGTGTATAQLIELEDFSGSSLSANQVIHAVTSGSFGDISALFVENITNNQYTYGILTDINGSVSLTGARGSYEVFTNGSRKTYSASFYNNITKGTAVALQLDGSSLVSLKALSAVETLVSVSAVDASRIKIGEKVYPVAQDVQIIKRSSSGYSGLSRHDISDITGKTVNLYADGAISAGGTIRVIVVTN